MSGQAITFNKGKLQVPDQVILPYVEGDGIGADVWKASVRVFDAAVEKAYGSRRTIHWEEILAGQKAFNATGQWLPHATIEAIDKYRVLLKGPLTLPMGGGIRSLNVVLRHKLDLYACVRPIRYFDGLPSPMRDPSQIDVKLFRERTEDIYAGIEARAGTEKAELLLEYLEEEWSEDFVKIRFGSYDRVAEYNQSGGQDHARVQVGIGIKAISRQGTERLIRTAIGYALQYNRKSVSLIHKGNPMKFTEGAFRDWAYQLAEKEFGDQVYTWAQYDRTAAMEGLQAAKAEKEAAEALGKLFIQDVLMDSAVQQLLTQPEAFDVIAVSNQLGDYLSHMLLTQVGGTGLIPAGYLNERTGYALFEPSHGTAMGYAKQNKANPSSMILAGAMLFSHIGWQEAADVIIKGLETCFVLQEFTHDLARSISDAFALTCSAFGDQVIKNMP